MVIPIRLLVDGYKTTFNINLRTHSAKNLPDGSYYTNLSLTPMHKKNIIIQILFFSLLCSFFIFSGCQKDNTQRIAILKVESSLFKGGPLPPASPENHDIIYYMMVVDEVSKERYGIAVGRIEGFEYMEGYEYRIKVLITNVINPPADAHIESYQLIEILSKTKI